MLVIPKALVKSPISAYENTLEVETVAALEEIISDPDSMRMQALLVRERILGPAHPDTRYGIIIISFLLKTISADGSPMYSIKLGKPSKKEF